MQLNVEQKRIIQSKLMGHSLLKGVAGSGKTTVAVSRISFLLNNYCYDTDDRILMVTYNKSLTNYINYIYRNICKNIDNYDINLFDKNDNREKLDILNIDKLIYKYFLKYKSKYNIDVKIMSDKQKLLNIIHQCIVEVNKYYNDIKIIDFKFDDFLLEEIQWIKSCNYMDLAQYQTVDRIGRMNGGEGPQKLQKNSRSRDAIYSLMLLYNKKMFENHWCDFEAVILYVLKYVKNENIKKYTHIIIDESQDLSKTQLEFIIKLYNELKQYSSILFVADTAQSIYTKSWLIKGRSFTSIGLDMTGKSNSLSKNYRTTTQIAEAAYSLIENDENIVLDDNFVKPSLIDRQGSYPVLMVFDTYINELNYIKLLIKSKLLNKYNLKDIAIIARTRNLLEVANNTFKKDNILCSLYSSNEVIDFNKDTIKLLTMHSIKGLEFKIIIIISLSNNIIPNINVHKINYDNDFKKTMERKLLYVGMTRATEMLYMSCNGEKSILLNDINPKFLKLNSNSKIRSYYAVDLENILFLDKLDNPYSDEEKIRQWFINELVCTYKYPLDLIDIEYKVDFGSKFGFVDIVVYIYDNYIKIPYIFVELKKIGFGITEGLEQLKNYMSVANKCQYGIVSDGNEFLVIDKNYDILEDIPSFDSNMIPSSIESYTYIDLKHTKEYKMLRDSNNISEIIVDNDIYDNDYSKDKLIKLNILNDIAAGNPIYINDCTTDEFYLPKHWLTDNSDCFILTVKGNSMIEAKIDDGDYVVIKYQQTADNRNIVAVDIDGGYTLKRYMPMGSTVLLLPENKEYEPIQISAYELRIIGVAVGIIKKT